MTQEQGRKLPYKVIGEYRPTTLHPDAIRRDLIAMLTELGYKGLVGIVTHIRDPSWFDRYAEGSVPYSYGGDADWHHDDAVESGEVIWSTKSPTQIRIGPDDPNIFTPEPYQVVLIDNRVCQHRRYGDMKDRWFARLFVQFKPGDL